MITMKKIINVYKGHDQWLNSPPGLGDFIRGSCHLHELLIGTDIDFAIDISLSDFKNHIIHDENLFSIGEFSSLINAKEFFTDHKLLIQEINEFKKNNEEFLFVSTNYGDWNRINLPMETTNKLQILYNFKNLVSENVTHHIPITNYEVLSIRCGDSFYGISNSQLDSESLKLIFKIIDEVIINNINYPIVVTSDSFNMKKILSDKYGFLMLPHLPEHGAFNSSCFPVCLDMHLLKNSKFNYHINTWANWWSGFSHFTSQIFSIPSLNFRAPEFIAEKIS